MIDMVHSFGYMWVVRTTVQALAIAVLVGSTSAFIANNIISKTTIPLPLATKVLDQEEFNIERKEKLEGTNDKNISCDYLVIGSGAASLAFIDTLLTELPDVKVILVDKHPAPGGHWNDAYDFVSLHQPSILYGVTSKQLEGNWLSCLLKEYTLPWKHHATKTQILAYFKSLVDGWVGKGKVEYYNLCKYDFTNEDGIHKFYSLDGKKHFNVKVNIKLINAVLMEPIVPSIHPVDIPIEEGITLSSPNDVFRINEIGLRSDDKRRFLVLGCGKTGTDTILYLQRKMGVDPDHITWIISNDVWCLKDMFPSDYATALIEFDGDKEKTNLALEERGCFIRLDESVLPTQFRFAVTTNEDIVTLRKVKKVIRRGRVASICRHANQDIFVQFGSDQNPLTVSSAYENIIVDCCSPGPFNGNTIRDIFISENEMNLAHIFAPPISLSMSCLAMLEAARMKKTLDLDFGRKLLAAEGSIDQSPLSEIDVLKGLFRAINLGDDRSITDILEPIRLLGVFLVLLNHDHNASFDWIKGNRLSVFQYGFKSHIYENTQTLLEKKDIFGLTKEEESFTRLLCEKLSSLQGK